MKRKIIAAGLLSSIVIMTAGCSGKGVADKAGDAESVRYAQTYMYMPEDESVFKDIVKLEDDTIRAAGARGVYDSADNGETWEQINYGSPILDELYGVDSPDENRADSACIALRSDGTLFLSYSYMSDEFTEQIQIMKNVIVDADGTEHELEIDFSDYIAPQQPDIVLADQDSADGEMLETTVRAHLYDAVLTADDKIIGTAGTGQVFAIDAGTGEILQGYGEADDNIDSYTIYKEQLIVYDEYGFSTYDLSSGVIIDNLPVIEACSEDNNYGSMVLVPDEKNDTLYLYISGAGIYKLTESAAVPELLLAAEDNAIASAMTRIEQVLVLDEKNILCTFAHADRPERILYFSYEDSANKPVTELTLYSLKKDTAVEQSILDFQEQNSGYKIHYTWGMEADEPLRMTDVLKNLNTEILSGNGPDILMIDGIPADSYIKSGAFAELSDIAEVNKGGYFGKVMDAYNNGDGVYAVPTRLITQVVMGKLNTLSRLRNSVLWLNLQSRSAIQNKSLSM